MTFPITVGHFTRTSGTVATSSTIAGAIGNYIYVAGIFDVAGVISSIVTDGGDVFTFDSVNVGGVSTPTPFADVLGVAKVYAARMPALTAIATEVTINFSTAQSFVGGFVWTGSSLTSPVIDQSSYATGNSTTPNSGTTATLSGSTDDAVAFAYSFNTVSAINSPWTSDGADGIGDIAGHQSLSSTAGISGTFTASNDNWGALAIAYKSGGGPTPLALSGRIGIKARLNAGTSGKALLTARSMVAAKTSGGISGKSALAGSVSVQAKAQSSPSFPARLAAIIGIRVKAQGAAVGAAALSGKITQQAKQSGGISGRAALAGRISIAEIARAAVVGRLFLAARSSIAAKAQAGVAGRGALSGTVGIQAKVSGSLIGRAALSARMLIAAKLQGSAAAAGVIALIGRIGIALKLQGTPSGTTSLSGRIGIQEKASGGLSGRAALAGAVKIATRLQSILTVGGIQLIGRIGIAVGARGAPTGKAALSGTIKVQETASAALTGRVGLSGRVLVAITGSGSTATRNIILLVGRIGIALKAAAGLAGRLSLSGHASIQAKGAIQTQPKIVLNPNYIARGARRRFNALGQPRNLLGVGARRHFVVVGITNMSQTSPAILEPPIDAVVEIETVTFDYGLILKSGITITAVSDIAISVVLGSDSSPTSRLVGSSQIMSSPTSKGAKQAVGQLVGTMIAGATYLIQCVVTTSDGQTLSLYARLACVQPA